MAEFTVQQLHHVNIGATDLDEAQAFYRDDLGLTELERPAFASPGLWFGIGEAQLHISMRPEPAIQGNHFALRVDDLDALVTHLEARGRTIRRLPVVAGAGTQVTLRDPSGNLIELRQ